MDYKDIVEKSLKGEDITEDTKDFDETQTKELSVAIKAAAKAEYDAELAKVTAIRKEKQRLETPPPDKKEDPAQSQLRLENLQLAKEEFFADPKFKLTDEEKTQFDEEFKKADSGKMAPKLIISDLRKAFVIVRGDKLLDSQERMTQFERDAANHMANQAGGSGGGGSPDDDKFSPEAKELHKRWFKQGIKDKTLQDAQNLVERGEDWKGRSLSD